MTPDALGEEFEATWRAVVKRLESEDGSRLRWDQPELARAVARGLADRLEVTLVESEARPAATKAPWLRLLVGDTELAKPVRVWLSTGDGAPEAEIARLRWLPRNLYRALGFLLHLRKDSAQLSRARQREHSGLPAWVCFVDTVGVADARIARELEGDATRVRVLGWSSRLGDLTPPELPAPGTGRRPRQAGTAIRYPLASAALPPPSKDAGGMTDPSSLRPTRRQPR